MSYLVIGIIGILIIIVGIVLAIIADESSFFIISIIIAAFVCFCLLSSKWDKEIELLTKDKAEHPLTVNTIQEVKLKEHYTIQAVSSCSDVNGGGNMFYLYANTEDVYKVWRNDKEYPELIKLPTTRTKIIEDSHEVPHVEVYKSVIKGRKYNKNIVSYKLFVPDGTITTDFSIK